MSKAASAPPADQSAHTDADSVHGNRVMLGILAGCISASVTAIIVAGVTGSVFVLVLGVVVMAISVGVMLTALNGLIGTEHETYGEA